jgi:hypothetical protein
VDTARRKGGQALLTMMISAEPKKEIKTRETKHHNGTHQCHDNQRIILKKNTKAMTESAIGMNPSSQKHTSLSKTSLKKRDCG